MDQHGKSINIIHITDERRKSMIIQVDSEQACNKIPAHFLFKIKMKLLSQLGIEGNFLNLINSIHLNLYQTSPYL